MKNKIKIESLYLILALVFGMLFIFLIPPFQSPDEDSHFKRAYTVSKGDFYAEDNGKMIGNYFPDNLLIYISTKTDFIGNRDKKFTYSQFVMDNQTLNVGANKTFNNYSTIKINPAIYSVPALGIIFTKIMSLFMGIKNTLPNLLYGARLMSLFIYSLMIFYAIKISPKFKRSMVVVALMPMTLALLCGVSYDGLLIASTFLLFGVTLKNAYDDKISKVSKLDIGIILFIMFVYINVKYVYILNLLILLLIPRDKFKVEKKDVIKRYIIPLSLMLVLFFITNCKNFFLDFSKYEPSNDIFAKQTEFVLYHPIKYTGIFFKEIFCGRFYYISSFVNTIGLLDTYSTPFFTFFYLLFMIFVLVVDSSEYKRKITWVHRLIGLFVPFICIYLCFLAMYLYWTPMFYGVASNVITGVQGRYFIPALCTLPLLTVNNLKLTNINKKLENVYGFVIFTCLTFTIITVLLRYWI